MEGPGRGLRAGPGLVSRPLCCAARHQLGCPDSLPSPLPGSGKSQGLSTGIAWEMGGCQDPEADGMAGQSGAGSNGWADFSELLWCAQSARNWTRWVQDAAERSRATSQGSLPDCPALCPGPATPAAALRAGGEHGTDLAPHQQTGCPAPAALPGLAHCDHIHHLSPVKGQPLSRPPASAHGGEE